MLSCCLHLFGFGRAVLTIVNFMSENKKHTITGAGSEVCDVIYDANTSSNLTNIEFANTTGYIKDCTDFNGESLYLLKASEAVKLKAVRFLDYF